MAHKVHLRDVVGNAIPRVETLIYSYPKQFDNIEDVKAYIEGICESKGFQYGIPPEASPSTQEATKDKIHFLVASRAYRKKEFYLDRYHRKFNYQGTGVLRDDVEADIKRVEALIPSWPEAFLDINVAKAYVRNICDAANFQYTQFPGVKLHQFRTYVTYNTALHAFEAGKFSLDNPPSGQAKSPAKTMAQTSSRTRPTVTASGSASTVGSKPAVSDKPMSSTSEQSTRKQDTLEPKAPIVGSELLHLEGPFVGELGPIKDATFNELVSAIQLGLMKWEE